jgi:hypothetical protein
MPSTELNAQTVDALVKSSWTNVMNLVEGGHPLSSEKTLCFLFAMEIWKNCNGEVQLDFENQCYAELQGKSKYLDLLASHNNGFKLAVEFKLPQKSKTGNSNQTQTRVAIYRDLARLNWLKNHSICPNASYFLMATNEDPYLNNANLTEHPSLITRHAHIINYENNLEVEGLSLNNVACQFNWTQITNNGSNRKIGKYAWLNPIRV